jgi:NADH-quinone oxidoreductase subunit J
MIAAVLFYVLAALALAGAAGVILARSAMGSVLSLLGTFFALAVIYLLAGFQFLAAAQILVYAGAILVLFLFVIMLLNLGTMGTKFHLSFQPLAGPRAKVAVAVAVALALIGLVAAQRASLAPSPAGPTEGIDDLDAIAVALFGRYSLPFQAASVLLLATMVAVVVLAKRQAPRSSPRPGRGDSIDPDGLPKGGPSKVAARDLESVP